MRAAETSSETGASLMNVSRTDQVDEPDRVIQHENIQLAIIKRFFKSFLKI